MSFTFIATQSIPIVSYFLIMVAMIVLEPTPSVQSATPNAVNFNDVCKVTDRKQDSAHSVLRPRALNAPNNVVQARVCFGGIDAGCL